MRVCIFAILFIFSLSLSALEQKGFKPSESVVFKKTSKEPLKLHFFLPEGHKKNDGQKRPAIVFFFGGGWSGGSPSQFYPFCQHLARQGMVAVSAQYRTKKSHGVDPMECVKDGKSAIRWVRAHAKEYGIDPNRIAAGGGSAGGHVAATTGTATDFEEDSEDKSISSWPNLLVLCNPVVDNSKAGYGFDRVKDYWQKFSPLHNITKETPPSIFFLGSKDKLIPVATGKAWDAKIKAVGQASELHVWEGAGHGFFNQSKEGGKYYKEILVKMDAFLKAHSYLK
jgi:acetyl esterase